MKSPVLAVVTLATLLAAPSAALAQAEDPGGSERAALGGHLARHDADSYMIPLYGDRAACISGLELSVQLEFWSLFDEPVVLSQASYELPDGDLQIDIFRDVGPIEEFDCAGGRIATVGEAADWDVYREGENLVEFGAPSVAFRRGVRVYGFEFSMDVTPNTPPAAPPDWYIEDFSGVFTSAGTRSFNVPGSPSWNRLFYTNGERYVREFQALQPLSEENAKHRLNTLFNECPVDNPCRTRLSVRPVIKARVHELIRELTGRSERFRDLYYDNSKEALVDELVAGAVGESSDSKRERREDLLQKALDGFEGEIHPDIADQWAEAREYERRIQDAVELRDLGGRLRAEIADEGEASDGLRGRVRTAANAVEGDWGQGRARLLLEWAAHERPEPVARSDDVDALRRESGEASAGPDPGTPRYAVLVIGQTVNECLSEDRPSPRYDDADMALYVADGQPDRYDFGQEARARYREANPSIDAIGASGNRPDNVRTPYRHVVVVSETVEVPPSDCPQTRFGVGWGEDREGAHRSAVFWLRNAGRMAFGTETYEHYPIIFHEQIW